MTTERRKLRDLFDQVVELPPADQAAFLAGLTGLPEETLAELRALLDAHARMEPLLDKPAFRLPPPPAEFSEEKAGPYRLIRKLGKGGTGVVYLARRDGSEPDQIVAVKILHPALASTPVAGRFEQEKDVLARLRHPGIARLQEAGVTAKGLPYLVIEFVDGVPVTTYCREQKLDSESRLRIFARICHVVAHAHLLDVIHKDLKPANILVQRDSSVKLLDFGIASIVHQEDQPGDATVTIGRMLTPDFASPEQMTQRPISKATDIYSLGVILFHMLAERAPYELRDRLYTSIVRAVCEGHPLPLSSVVSGLPRAKNLDAVILQAMHRNPEARYQSAVRLQADIERYLAGQPVEAASAGSLFKRALNWNWRG